MRTNTIRRAIAVAVLALALAVPSAAMANGFFVERSLVDLIFNTTYDRPVVSGDNVIYMSQSTAPGSRWVLQRFNIATGSTTVFHADPTYSVESPRVSGDWVVWMQNSDIKAKNIRTGALKSVTDDGAMEPEAVPDVNGNYVVWSSWDGSTWDVKGKNLATTGSVFTVAGGADHQFGPSIYGKRVAYLDSSNAHFNVYVKTIGSTAAPKKITDNAFDQASPSIGDHLVAWLTHNASGKDMIRYFDYNTGGTYDGPSSASYDMVNPQVSGDRILYNSAINTSDQDLFIWDTRVARWSGSLSTFRLAGTGNDEKTGAISGNDVAYIAGITPIWGRLAVPSISLSSVPTRIPRGGHIHLKGSVSDQGHRVGYANLAIEKYASGKWTRIKTLTAKSTGAFSYQTPRTYSKTSYRVVYYGWPPNVGAGALSHFSAVSSSRTAWPR